MEEDYKSWYRDKDIDSLACCDPTHSLLAILLGEDWAFCLLSFLVS